MKGILSKLFTMKYFILTVFFITNILSAQSVIPVVTTSNETDKPIELKRLKISVFVTENIATTTLEMQFFNNNDRVMEGELNFPLDNGVTVSRFALEVNGEMREGVVVDKEKATQTFEAITRQNIDPGLVEVTKGNNFKARIYPIPPKGYKKATIAFEQELIGDDKNYFYQLPLNFQHTLEKFSATVEVVMSKPEVIKSDRPTINLEFTDSRNSYISEYHKKNVKLKTRLAFAIPKSKTINKVLIYKGSVSPDNYFYININPKVEYRSKPKPTSITILWDESASSKNRNIEKELKILEKYLSWVQNGSIELITFSNTSHSIENYTINDGSSKSLSKRLKESKFDGGTNIGSINFNDINTSEILLFTDGISNFGSDAKLESTSPVTSINTSNIADHNLLEHYASASNGIYINAFTLTTSEAIGLLTKQQKRFIKAEYDNENIKEFYPKPGVVVSTNFSCSGKVEGAVKEVKISFGFGNIITESYIVTIDNSNRIDNNVGERIWAQKKLRALLANKSLNEVKEHGKKYKLVTPGTSLIVLDEVDDYVRFEITPPESLLKEYNQLISQKIKNNAQTRENRLGRICEEFESDFKWWETVKDYRNKPKETKEVIENTLSGRVSGVEVNENDMELEEVVVTGYQRSSENNNESSMEPSLTYTSSLKLNQWESNAQYMSDLKAVDSKDLYTEYLKLRTDNEDNPSFYFDVATYMFQKSQKDDGLRVLSNLAEFELESTELMRVLARTLSEHEFYDEAIYVFKKVMALRSFEPHSYIDLGMTYAEKGEYQKAIDNLYSVISKDWDSDIISRFSGIEMIVLHDINNIIYHHNDELDISEINDCFIKHMPVDIRVLIDWNANDTDIDLWTTDPREEICNYQNKETRIGGKISNDITQGYGPEEFRLKHAIEGKYIIEANFFGTRKQTLLGNVTVRAIVYTNFGSVNENKEIMNLQLEPNKNGNYTIGEMNFESFPLQSGN